jgi:cell division protein FtsB
MDKYLSEDHQILMMYMFLLLTLLTLVMSVHRVNRDQRSELKKLKAEVLRLERENETLKQYLDDNPLPRRAHVTNQ